jgi:predicted PurR-regulated permease PerM
MEPTNRLVTTPPAPRGSAIPQSVSTPHRVEIHASHIPPTSLGTLAVGVVTVAALYFGREVVVPMALAILLGFALAPLVLLLRRWHLGRVPSVIAVVVLAFLMIVGIGAFVGNQLAHLAGELPGYQTNIAQKIRSLRDTTTKGGVVDRTSAILSDLNNEITKPEEKEGGSVGNQVAALPRNNQPQDPVPVEIRRPNPSPFLLFQQFAVPLLQPFATAGIVVVFVIFFLLQREDLRDRFIRLAGAGDLRRTTLALDDAASRLSRYLLTQTAINTSFGVLIGTGLWFIDVPHPMLWGILGMLLRFVPYIGPVIAAALPAIVAFAVEPGWAMLLWAIALFLVVELAIGQVIEPWLYGHSTGLSGIAVVVAAAFWTLLWGPVGLLLSTPLTMCLVVLGRHVEQLQFLEVLLGDRPALAPEEAFYQRMLAGDPDEAAHQAEEFLQNKSLAAYYDEVAIGGLTLAQWDVNRGALGHEHRVLIKESVEGVIDNLADHAPWGAQKVGENGESEVPPVFSQEELAPVWRDTAVLCVAGRGSLDEASAAMLAQLLQKHGIGARVVPSEAVSVPNLFRLDVTGVQMAFLCYLEPGSFSNPCYLVRRLRRKLPKVTIVAGFWTLKKDEIEERNAVTLTGADLVAVSLRQAVEQVIDAVQAGADDHLNAENAGLCREPSSEPAGYRSR